MTALTHAVFDATTSDQAGPSMTTEAAFAECARMNREHGGGYVVGPLRWKPPPAAPKPAAGPVTHNQPEAPTASVALDPEGPGLFD